MYVILIILAIIVLIAIYGVSIYNGLVALKNQVQEAFSTMDVYLQKRYDLIPNLVETVKGYAKHENQTFENVIKARNSAVNATTIESKVEAQGEIQNALGRLFALAENYPELKANTNFLDLQNQLNNVETDIANARSYYNGVVRTYNTKIESFPSNVVAGMFKFTQEPMYEVQSEEARQNVKVEF
ncbi:LemA family protein [Mycoplasma sp. P36-A1]|uniref:LemA family protein n=1 Tax=Mycoplasma sp. P36-A1 TaxID=3252900 RepID=UPI003C2C3529